MRILIAPDKFKGSLSARQVAENIALGIREVIPDAQIEITPVADGGEGTAEVICNARGGEWVTCRAHGPPGDAIEVRYGRLGEGASAVVETSEVAGTRAQEQRARLPLQLRIIAAVDVQNPLLGENGATRTFGPQKGARPDQIEILERALTRLADTVTRDLGCDFRNNPGAGAAGGLGFGLMS